MDDKKVPITLGFDQTTIFGSAMVFMPEIIDAKFLANHVLAPAYRVNDDGTVELIELSWIATAKAPYVKRKRGPA